MPGLGNSGGKSKIVISVGWRYAKASTGYFNSRVNHDITDALRPRERFSILDVTARYRINKRSTILATLPVPINRFSLLLPPGTPQSNRYGWNSSNVGDLAFYSETVLFDPAKHPFGNTSVGLGLKIPTGNWNLKQRLPDASGTNFASRAVYPPAIMPGDGGTGIIVGFQSYKVLRRPTILRLSSVFVSGTYLISPRNTNGTRSVISNLGVPLLPVYLNRLTNSVADTYQLNAGMLWRPPLVWQSSHLRGLRLMIVGKFEGLNTRDLIGRSDGFRSPGYTLAAGPGLVYSYGPHTLIAEVPIVFNRHINPGATSIPGIATPNGLPAPFDPNRQVGLLAPASLSVRYVHSF